MTEVARKSQKVLLWDLDETLIIFQTLTTGRFAQAFQGAKDSHLSIKLGRRWEKLIIQICDEYFFYEQVEDFNEPNLEAWRKFDDGKDLSTYEFSSDGLGETKDLANNQKLAYRHRWISELYLQGLETLLTAEQLQEWQELYELTDAYTDGWLTAALHIQDSFMECEASESPHFINAHDMRLLDRRWAVLTLREKRAENAAVNLLLAPNARGFSSGGKGG